MSDAANSQENSGRGPAEHLKAYQFKPGQSGNPKGRPKRTALDDRLAELLEADEDTQAGALAKALLIMALSGDTQAAKLVAERAYGKPTQKVEHSGPDGGAIQGEFTVRFVKANG